MKLCDWLTKAKVKLPALKDALGVSHEAARLYVRGKRIPRPLIMARIVEITRGEVTATDFYDQPASETAKRGRAA